MPLPPARLPKPIRDAIGEVLTPSARRIGAGLLTLLEAGLCGKSKSEEERLLDFVEGEISANDRRQVAIARLHELASDPNVEHQRILARAATLLVPSDRFIMPTIAIAGKIFRDSEFDEPGSAIWEMWAQLLARACDKDRVGEAHPSFPLIISQLSSDEAKLLASLAPLQPRAAPFDDPIPLVRSTSIGIAFPSNLYFYLDHIAALGLIVQPTGWQPTGHLVMIDEIPTYMLTGFGQSFMSAVSNISTD